MLTQRFKTVKGKSWLANIEGESIYKSIVSPLMGFEGSVPFKMAKWLKRDLTQSGFKLMLPVTLQLDLAITPQILTLMDTMKKRICESPYPANWNHF